MLALVVDDSRAMRIVLRRALVALGFDVVEADNGRAALATLQAMPAAPALVLADWNMPEMDGLEMVAAVRAQPAWGDIRVMMVSCESEQGRIVRALDAGAQDYMIKPFTSDALSCRLRGWW